MGCRVGKGDWMKLESYDIDDAPNLAGFYNSQIADLPYRYSVSEEEFEWGIRHQRYKDAPYDDLHSERIIVGTENGEVRGFVHVGVADEERDGEIRPVGVIRFMVYEPGYRPQGQALLDASEACFADLDLTRISALHGDYLYRFWHMEHGFTTLLGHVTGLMSVNGYDVAGGEIFMAWPDFEVVEPAAPSLGSTVQAKEIPRRGDLPGLHLGLWRNDSRFGACDAYCVGHYQPAPEAQDQFFVVWLGIREAEQGKGWGRYLLQRMLWEMKHKGYRHAFISTDHRNYRALVFYTNMGFQAVDISYEYAKTLGPCESKS